MKQNAIVHGDIELTDRSVIHGYNEVPVPDVKEIQSTCWCIAEIFKNGLGF